MDAECKEARRKSYLESRKQRWSMNSQRLEAIVAKLMRPIGDLRRSFDTDLSALLEEYLTEAGLHALDACSGDEGEEDTHAHGVPNFVELALLLQQSASIYGRKVDFLYQHVLSVSDSLHSAELTEMANRSTEEETPGAKSETPSRRRAGAAAASEWAGIELVRSQAAARDAGEAPRPPPTLPRAYVELEPRALAPCDAPLTDYAGEPVGLLPDFHVTWRLHEGMLVEELEGAGAGSSPLRAIPLTELQAALNARAPPLPPPSPPPSPHPSPPPSPPPTHASTPLPRAMEPLAVASPPPPPPPDTCKRKRKCEPQPENLKPSKMKLLIGKRLRRELRREREFSIPEWWVRAEVRRRSARVLALRRACARACAPAPEFRGFEYSSCDANGFPGWSSAEAEEAACETMAEATRLQDAAACSDDDGFFEQSSSGDSDVPSRLSHETSQHSHETSQHSHEPSRETSQHSHEPSHEPLHETSHEPLHETSHEPSDEPSHRSHNISTDSGAEWWSWQAGVAARAAEAEARGGVDVRALAARVLGALPDASHTAPYAQVMRAAAKEPTDVSRLFLATLFLANAGNVEVIQGAPLSVDSFSLRLLSRDERLYGAAAAQDAALLQPAGASADSARASSSADSAGTSAGRKRRLVR